MTSEKVEQYVAILFKHDAKCHFCIFPVAVKEQ